LLDPLRDRLRERLPWQPMPRLVLARLGADAACAGAALLARDLLSAVDGHLSQSRRPREGEL
jgi:hypothetical protein